jgi:hypothetical protein
VASSAVTPHVRCSLEAPGRSEVLGSLAEALLEVASVLLVPAVIALVVLLVWRFTKSHNEGSGTIRGNQALVSSAPAAVYVAISMVTGAAAAFISLEAYYGIALAATAGILLFRQARRHRWFALGGFLLGMGLCAAGFLSRALTNHDPAVTYDPSTIPFFWAAVVVAFGGAVTLVAAATPPLRRGRA